MARMIPSEIPQDAPPGERKVFDGLKSLAGSEDWVVLHSLWLASKQEKSKREADFVVLIPNCGIVTIEVKSHERVHRSRDGRWHLGQNEATPKSPFVQADDARWSLYRLITRDYKMKTPNMESCVWFTGVNLKNELPASPEWHEWQVLDASDLSRIKSAVEGVLEYQGRHSVDGPDSRTLTKQDFGCEEVEKLASKLRPKFDASMPKGEGRRRSRIQLDSLLQEQMQALDSMRSNPRVIFSGAAGTGKTHMALEQARRLAECGKQGRLLCFNRNLADHLESTLRDVPNVRVATFHREMLDLSGLSPTDQASQRNEFWREEVPNAALDSLTRSDEHRQSFLIVDEAQDLGVELYMDALDGLVEGGFSSGIVYAFADFQRQAIYEAEDAEEVWLRRMPSVSRFDLETNCRNLPHIGMNVNLVLRPPAYNLERFRRPPDGYDNPILAPAADADGASVVLHEYVMQLKDAGYKLHEIVILSPRKQSATLKAFSKMPLGNQLCKDRGVVIKKNRIRHTTIHSFKGLESPAVIVVDVSDESVSSDLEELLYVGMTRATDRCLVLVEPDTFRRLIGGGA